MSVIPEELKAKAEIYHGDEICQEKTKCLLQDMGLPNGLLPLKDIIECGRIEETGYVWLKQKKKIEHCFEKIDKLVTYDTEITAYVEQGKIKKLTGVKAKEMLVWVTLNEISLDEPAGEKLAFKAIGGIFRTFPTSAFVVEEEEKGKQEDKEQEEEKKDEAAAKPLTAME